MNIIGKPETLTLLLAISLFACHKDDDNIPTNPIDQLPPATQVGANTAGAMVNGEPFLPNNQSVQPLVCNYLDQDDFFLLISKKVDGVYYNLDIYIYIIPLLLSAKLIRSNNMLIIPNSESIL